MCLGNYDYYRRCFRIYSLYGRVRGYYVDGRLLVAGQNSDQTQEDEAWTWCRITLHSRAVVTTGQYGGREVLDGMTRTGF